MSDVILKEYDSSPAVAATGDGIYEVTFITEGKGSSGTYSRALLEEYGPAAFPAGTLMFYNHLGEEFDAHERDIRTAVSKILDSAYVVEEGIGKVKGHVQVVPSERDFIDFFHKEFGVSIYTNGTAEFNEATRELDVTSFDLTDPYRSVDWVVAAGRGGKVEKKIEDYRASEGADQNKVARLTESFQKVQSLKESKPPVALAEDTNKKGNTLEIKDLAEKIDSLTVSVQAILTAKENEAQAKADNDALVEARAKGAEAAIAAAEAIAGADLFDFQEKSLREAAARGEDISTAVEDAKKVAVAAREAAKPGTQTLKESGSTEGQSSTEGYVVQYGGTN